MIMINPASNKRAPTPAAKPAAGLVSGTGSKQSAPDAVIDGTDRSFMTDVIEASKDAVIVVDFWAPWCGPCKQLGPSLEKAVRATKGSVRLVKINIDENPAVAGQLRVQSIPAVYAFFGGRPVDTFAGALPDSQVREWVERLKQLAGPSAGGGGLEAAVAEGKAALDAGDGEGAADIFQQILEVEPAHPSAYAGLIRAFLLLGRRRDASRLLVETPKEIMADADIVSARAAIDLLSEADAMAPVATLEARLLASPDDHQSRFDLAMGQFAAGRREVAVEHLLDIVRRDREWHEQRARRQLLKLFDAFGSSDPITVQGRKKLSAILFS